MRCKMVKILSVTVALLLAAMAGLSVSGGVVEASGNDAGDFYLHGTAPSLTLDNIVPTSATANYVDSPAFDNKNGRTTWQQVGTWEGEVTESQTAVLESLGQLQVWLGLKNSDDQGTNFDLQAEVLLNGTTIGMGTTTNIKGVTRNPHKALEAVVPLALTGGKLTVKSGDMLGIKISAKVTATGGHNNAVGLRLYYDAASRPTSLNIWQEKYAIIVGISDYPGSLNVLQGGLDLFYSDNDANAMRTALIGHGFKPGNISVFTNDQATKENILDQIHEVRDEAGPLDEVVFYFSGHSVIPDTAPPDPVAGLWPTNAPTGSDVGLLVWGGNGQTAVVFDTELQQAFSGFETTHIVFGFDSCWAARFDEVAGPGRVVVMASGSTTDAIAGEYGPAYALFGMGPLPPPIGWMNQGLFTYFFAVQGLTEGMAPDMDGDKVISAEEAFAYVQSFLTQWSDQFSSFGLNEKPEIIDESNGDFHL